MAENDQHWPLMAAIMGRPDLATAPGYAIRSQRGEHGVEVHELMAKWVGSHTSDEVEAAVEKAGLPWARVQTVAEVLKDPNLKARGMFKEMDFYGEVLPLFGPYPVLSETPGSFKTPYPKLGQHNEEIYCGLLGFSKKDLASLKSEGVI